MEKPNLQQIVLATTMYSLVGWFGIFYAATISDSIRQREQETEFERTYAELQELRTKPYDAKQAEAYEYDSMNRQRGK